jgi:hypothetical protein
VQEFDGMETLVHAQVLVPVEKSQTLKLQMVGRNGKPLRLRQKEAKEWISRYFMPRMTAAEVLEVGSYTDVDTGKSGNEVLDWLSAIEKHLALAQPITPGAGQLSTAADAGGGFGEGAVGATALA